MVIALRLGSQETTNAHGNCARNELSNAAKDDELGLPERRKTRGKSEGDSEAVREADDAVRQTWDISASVRLKGGGGRQECEGCRTCRGRGVGKPFLRPTPPSKRDTYTSRTTSGSMS